MREVLQFLFAAEGYGCHVASDATTALEIVDRQMFDVVVSDIRMDGMSGLELLDRVRKPFPSWRQPLGLATCASLPARSNAPSSLAWTRWSTPSSSRRSRV
jgi:CheY-like chemotaxis protein